jgi:hypothetical protein
VSPYDAAHEYIAVDPYVVVGAFTEPLTGAESAPQLAMTQLGAEPLQVPVSWHVRVDEPDKL